ncbi:MAG: type II secretion system protein [Erysipelotrichia bacterium]|jgi:prepilin-type N-terminal cleavage/methylation domain-containing protein|nr:type II secretion system protein [Erysipelotrichia bacterium]
MRKLSKGGMTLIEVVVAIAIFGIVMVTIFPAVLVLNLMNTYSYEKLDTAFIAQEEMEAIVSLSRNESFNNVRDFIINTRGYTLTFSDPHYIFTRNESNYTITITMTQIDNSRLYNLFILVTSSTTSSTVDIAGNRTQLETIISLN